MTDSVQSWRGSPLGPSPVQHYLQGLHDRHAPCVDGEVATYVPGLGGADPSWFGICVVTVDGAVYEVGDTHQPFTIQSASKPFTFGLALEALSLLGEMALINAEQRGADVDADTDLDGHVLSVDSIEQLLALRPEVRARLLGNELRIVSRRADRMRDELTHLID